MDDTADRLSTEEIDWTQCASKLPPEVQKKLGNKLSSVDLVEGSSWETVADALNYNHEKRQEIKESAARHRLSEGYTLLHHWTGGNDKAHTLMVLKHALEKCERPDIMSVFIEGIKSMYSFSLCVAVKVASGVPDNETRPHIFRMNVNINDTLGSALEDQVPLDIRNYCVTVPDWAGWGTPAGDLKGNQVTITKVTTDETKTKEIHPSDFDNRVWGISGDQPFVPNIAPDWCLKILNDGSLRLPTSSPTTEEGTYMSMSRPEVSSSNNLSVLSSSLNATPSDFSQESQAKLPEDSFSRREPLGSVSSTGSAKRQHSCDLSDEDSDGSFGSAKDGINSGVDNVPPSSISSDGSPIHPPLSAPLREWSTHRCEPRLPDPHNIDPYWLQKLSLEPGNSDPAFSGDKKPGKRIKSKVFIPRAAQSFNMANMKGWHGDITMEKMEDLMKPYLQEDGRYIIWSFNGATERDNKLVISVTHEGKLLHYNIRARGMNNFIYYYLFKNVYLTRKVVHLVIYYTEHNLEKQPQGDVDRPVRLRAPVTI